MILSSVRSRDVARWPGYWTSEGSIGSEKGSWASERCDVPIEISEVERLLEPWLGSRAVTSAEFLRGGLMNRNYRVRVGDDDVVLRFYDRDTVACDKETRLLRALGGIVRVPDVLFADTTRQPTPIAVLEYVDAISLRDLKRAGDATAIADAACSAGQQLARLAAFALENSLLAADGSPIADRPSLGPITNAHVIDHFLDSTMVRERLGSKAARRVSEFGWRHDDALLLASKATRFAHGDFNSANILVRERNGRWGVAAILDWEFAFPGSIYYDIGNFLRYEREARPRFEPAFSRGLTDGGFELAAEWRTLARAADLTALCELLARPGVPDHVIAELRDLVSATVAAPTIAPRTR